MSNKTKPRLRKRTADSVAEQGGASKAVRYFIGWLPSLLATFAFMYAALLADVLFNPPPVVSMAVMTIPLFLTAALLKNSFKKLLFRSLIFVLLVNIILPEMVTTVFLLGEAWVLRQSWLVENPDGQKFRFIGKCSTAKNLILGKFRKTPPYPMYQRKYRNV